MGKGIVWSLEFDTQMEFDTQRRFSAPLSASVLDPTFTISYKILKKGNSEELTHEWKVDCTHMCN